jgi:hypothetical protein
MYANKNDDVFVKYPIYKQRQPNNPSPVPKKKNYRITGYATNSSLDSQKAEQYRAASPLCVLRKRRSKHVIKDAKTKQLFTKRQIPKE